MTLLQMTYMGVLESIEVKQKNFPYRRKFVEFYQRYEDLCSTSASKRFEVMVQEGADFEKLCHQIIEETLRGHAEGLYAFGHRKIFLKNELVQVIEKARSKAQEKKSKSVNIIQKCFHIQRSQYQHKDRMIKVRRIQRFWRRRGEIIITNRAKDFYEKAKSAMLKYKMVIDRERMEIEAKNRIVRALKRNVIRNKLTRYAVCMKTVNSIVHESWLAIRENAEKNSAIAVQRILKGFMEKKKHQNAIKKALEVRFDYASTKALRVIQKAFRGVMVRERLRILHLSAAYIQGHMRMRWLSTLFQKVRFEVRKIQR